MRSEIKKQADSRYESILAENRIYDEAYRRYVELHGTHSLYLCGLAPVVLEFVKWVLKSAALTGKKRLYFLARDGWQMYIAAKYIAKSYNLDIDCRYLMVSRYAMRIPEYHIMGEACLDRICIGGIDVTFGKLMERAGLSDGDGLSVARECGYAKRYDEVIGHKEISKIKEILKENKNFLDKVFEKSRLAYPAAIGYLKQEGLLDNTDYALVDSGWTGSLQQTIKNLCVSALEEKADNYKLSGYYFGLYETPKQDSNLEYQSFYFGAHDNIKRKVYFSNSLFEAVFSAPGGMTHHYEEHDGIYKAVTDMGKNPNGVVIEEYKGQLEEFMGLCGNLSVDSAIDYKLVETLLYNLMAKPGKEELEAFGDILFCDDVLENAMQEVSATLSDEELKNQHLFNKIMIKAGVKKGTLRESAWVEGSIAKKGVKVKKNLRHAAMYKYIMYIRKSLK